MKTLDTPALLLDLNKLESNINEINEIAKKNKVNWRPHIKTHKSIQIAKMQLQKGAIGITVAKLEEAEIMANSGINDILIAYPISSKQKIERLNRLQKISNITVAIDSLEQAEMLNEGLDQKVNGWIKMNSGLNRCGIEIAEVQSLAMALTNMDSIHLNGIFTHAGHSYASKNAEEIKKIALEEAATVINAANICEEIGISIQHRSVGSTPTFKYGASIQGITEIRPGNAAFYDMCQVGLSVATTNQCALTVLASVVSKKKDRIIFDTGSKALSLDQGAHGNKCVSGYGFIIDFPEITIERLSEEHGIAPLISDTTLVLNDKVQIIPNHACVVANLFDEYVVHRNGVIVDTWTVDARGKLK